MLKVIIVGGGRVGRKLITSLEKKGNYEITVIDSHEERIKKIQEMYDNINFIKGDATSKNVLKKAGIETADILVAATSMDEVNLLIGMSSQKYNLSKIIARTANPAHIKMFKKLGLNEVVSPELTTCYDIEREIIEPTATKMSIFSKDDCEIVEVTVKSNKIIGKTIGQVSPKKNYIIIMCRKGNEELIASNDIVLEKDDKITILVKGNSVKKVKKIFTKNRIIL